MNEKNIKIAVLISGSGTTLQNFIDLRKSGELPVDIKLVISSREGVKGLERAESANISTKVIKKDKSQESLFSKQINDSLLEAGVDLVCMAGFLSMWIIPSMFEGRVMNVHPALLPSFGGKGYWGDHVHRAVLEAGCKVTGCTVHFADNVYDNGPIILQKPVAVNENDTPETLGKRVRAAERILYPQAIRLFAQNKLVIEGRRVIILP